MPAVMVGAALSDDDELLAAELALGLLDAAERDAALRRVDADRAFADAHTEWEERAAALFDHAGEMPPVAVWDAVARGLPANDDIAPQAKMGALRWWQLATGVATAAAIALAVVAFRPAPPPRVRTVVVAAPAPPARTVVVAASAPGTPLVALLRGKGDAVVAVSFDRASGRLTITPSTFSLDDRAAELWVIPGDGKPRSLGVIDAGAPGSRVSRGGAARDIRPGATLAISLEPLGGSPTGQPTGKIVVTGKVEAI